MIHRSDVESDLSTRSEGARADSDVPFTFAETSKGHPAAARHQKVLEGRHRTGGACYRPHDNRHTHASHPVSSGLSLEIVGRLLGHTNPTTTKRYAHIADSPLRAATERFGAKLDSLNARSSLNASRKSIT
jgi:site-specific recombinase XerD